VVAPNAAEVLNLVGFVTGAALYAMLLALVLRGQPAGGHSRLPLATAVLGLTWNIGELAAYALPRVGLVQESFALWALSFPALGLLAAVVVHSVARELPRGRWLTAIAYGCSAAASSLQFSTVVTGDPEPSSLAFLVLTMCYGVIIVVLSVMTRSQDNRPRVVWVSALALFAVSASHLGRFHGGGNGWAIELIGHHASIPLAFAILYQDYRFALADLFLKRALTLIALVAISFAGYSLVTTFPAGPFAAGGLMSLWVATALLSPWLHRAVVKFVDQTLLRRVDYAALRSTIGQSVQVQETIEDVLNAAAAQLANALNARRVWWTSENDIQDPQSITSFTTVPTADSPRMQFCVGELKEGRRLLSDDSALLEAVGVIAARRIDQIRLTHERYEVQLREEEMLKLTAEAELKALRAQVNPHFLFNALTTIGYLIEAAPPRALHTLLQLTALLRGVLKSEGEFTTLSRELELVEHYLKIEHERFEERLRVRIDVPAALRSHRIPTLVLQPLVENAIKHGVAASTAGGDVTVAARVIHGRAARHLELSVRNSGAPLRAAGGAERGDHVGVDNIRRRLAGYYGADATFDLRTVPGGDTVATLLMPIDETLDRDEDIDHAEAAANRPR